MKEKRKDRVAKSGLIKAWPCAGKPACTVLMGLGNGNTTWLPGNGDIGFIRHIDPETQELTIVFEEKNIVYDFGELDEVTLAYATTIHKSQGSEYPAIVIPLMM